MGKIGRASLPSFAAGVACAVALLSLPALAAVTANDQNPTVFDASSPALAVQPVTFILGRSIEPADPECYQVPVYNYRVPMRLGWDATDATSGAASFDIYREFQGEEGQIIHGRTGATSLDVDVTNYDNDCGGGFHKSYWWVKARDHRGFTATSPMVSDHLDVWDEAGVDWASAPADEANLTVTRTGTWYTSRCSCHNHGATTYSSARNASLSYTFYVDTPGRTVAVVSPTSSNRGVMRIGVDGGAATSVNTFAPATVNRVIVWQQTLNAGQHTLTISNAGTTGRPRIDVDTIMLGPSWSGEAPNEL